MKACKMNLKRQKRTYGRIFQDYLKQFLNVYWLRPEVALWRTIDCMKMQAIDFPKPIADIGCGDGIFSFLRAGGKFGLGFDSFLSVDNLDNFFSNADIYNAFDAKKMNYDIVQEPTYKIDVGLDWKKSLLQKAKGLGLYEKTIEHGANYALPLADCSFNTVFSNILYWLDNKKDALKEFNRIVAPSGKIVLLVPDKQFKECLVYNEFLKNGSIWAKLLDRGRYNTMKNCLFFEEWLRLFESAGLEVIFHDTYFSKRFIQFWDIGLRPLSPCLIEMANALDKKKRMQVKEKWIESCFAICSSFQKEELQEKNGMFHLFVLRKKENAGSGTSGRSATASAKAVGGIAALAGSSPAPRAVKYKQ